MRQELGRGAHALHSRHRSSLHRRRQELNQATSTRKRTISSESSRHPAVPTTFSFQRDQSESPLLNVGGGPHPRKDVASVYEFLVFASEGDTSF